MVGSKLIWNDGFESENKRLKARLTKIFVGVTRRVALLPAAQMSKAGDRAGYAPYKVVGFDAATNSSVTMTGKVKTTLEVVR